MLTPRPNPRLLALSLALGALAPLAGCDQSTTLRNQGINLYNQGDLHGAHDKFEASLRENPTEWRGNYYAGATDYQLGRYSEAAYHYKLAWQANPTQGDLKQGFADSLIKEGKKDQALDFLERDATLTGKVADRLRVAHTYEEIGDLDNAEINYQKAAAMVPPEANTMIQVGEFYERVGKHQQAGDAFKQAYRLDPNRPGLVEMLQRNNVPLSQVMSK